jgi:hypothetical protein
MPAVANRNNHCVATSGSSRRSASRDITKNSANELPFARVSRSPTTSWSSRRNVSTPISTSTLANDTPIASQRPQVARSRPRPIANTSVATGIKLLTTAECDGVVRDKPSTKSHWFSTTPKNANTAKRPRSAPDGRGRRRNRNSKFRMMAAATMRSVAQARGGTICKTSLATK